MSDLKRTIAKLQIPSHSAFEVASDHFAMLEKKAPEIGARMRERFMGDAEFREKVMEAVADAVVFSVLALVLYDDADYEEAIASLETFDDTLIETMRLDIFNQSMDDNQTVSNVLGGSEKNIGARRKMFLDHFRRISADGNGATASLERLH